MVATKPYSWSRLLAIGQLGLDNFIAGTCLEGYAMVSPTLFAKSSFRWDNLLRKAANVETE